MLLNIDAGIAAKDAGQQLALQFAGDDWRDRVLVEFAAWAAVQRFKGFRTATIEQFRADRPGCQPDSHKAWGSLPRLLLKTGLIGPNLGEDGEPRYRLAAAPKTHAHPVRVWSLL